MIKSIERPLLALLAAPFLALFIGIAASHQSYFEFEAEVKAPGVSSRIEFSNHPNP